MRLELEPNPSQIVYSENAPTEMPVEKRAEEASNYLREGIKAAQSGNRSAARDALLRAAELDPRSESAWLWLSSISEYPEELLVFLTNVLEINPLNARALEWSKATRALLAKKFVQRGIDAAESGQPEMAAQHFNQALEYDERNSMAWLWLASLSDSNEGKLTYLEKVLEFDPENENAKAGLASARNAIRTGLLTEARAAAVAGKPDEADALLNAILAEEPDAEDAWVLRSHLATDFTSKIAAFKRILEINPDNSAAKAGLESLTAIMEAVTEDSRRQNPASADETRAAADLQAPAAFFASPVAESSFDELPVPEKSEDVTLIEEPIAETPWANFGLDVQRENADESTMVSPSPFDSFADENFTSDDGTMQIQTAGAGEAFEEVSDPGPSSVESIFEGEYIPPSLSSEPVDPPSADAGWWTGPSNGNGLPAGTDEGSREEPHADSVVEAIVYELAPESTEDESVTEAHPEDFTQQAEFAIPAPSANPFDGVASGNEADQFKTVVSIELDEETLAAVQGYDPVQPSAEEQPTAGDAFNVPFDVTMYGGQFIPMPTGELNQAGPDFAPNVEPRVENVRTEQSAHVSPSHACPFCGHENDVQVISCNSCLAVLTLADLELILANNHADKSLVRKAVERMEREKSTRELSESELTTIGIGHLNLRNLQFGYQYLHEAAQKNPDNVVLSGQVNALLIRLEEIKQQDAVHEAMSKGKTILVVDDSPTVRKLISGKLEKCGHEVLCSADGVEAIEALERVKPDLILLDITMPRMDGYQVCKLIRANDTLKDVPVVMISGKDGFFDKVRGRMAGTSGYITKPFGPETLMKAVESYLRADA